MSWSHARRRLPNLIGLCLLAVLLAPTLTSRPALATGRGVEPDAGTWKTWVIPNGEAWRLPPPDLATTRDELRQLRQLAAERDAAALDRVAYWDTGAPSYRWHQMLLAHLLKRNTNALSAARAQSLMHIAIFDATVAAWNTKYTYHRPRPASLDRRLQTIVPTPDSPAYPAEHAVAAGAASTVLAYLFPDEAGTFATLAEEAGQSRLLAGVDYPSDVAVGLDLGRRVGALLVERGEIDGSDQPWAGTIPEGPGSWKGQNPVLPQAAQWKPWVLASGSELRPGPPPAWDGPQLAAELAELKAFARTPKTNADAFFWEYAAGGLRHYWYWSQQTDRLVQEAQLAGNQPRTARVYALESVARYDATIACWDAKYTSWLIRPSQLDPTLTTLFPNPNHPSYPSAHGCLSTSATTLLGHLFPREREALVTLANEIGESRIWAGIHYRSDVTAGTELGRAVGNRVVERARSDGAE
jgi:membrane-associated phospholipid phosphatase